MGTQFHADSPVRRAVCRRPSLRVNDPAPHGVCTNCRRRKNRKGTMMHEANPDYAGLLAAVLANPDDDTPRLILADWLEERGDPYGEFIRESVATGKNPPRFESLMMMDLETLHHQFGITRIAHSRGFVEQICCPWRSWSNHAGAILVRQPVCKVKLATSPEFRMKIGPRSLQSRLLLAGYEKHKGIAVGTATSPEGAIAVLVDTDAIVLLLSQVWPRINFELPDRQPHLVADGQGALTEFLQRTYSMELPPD